MISQLPAAPTRSSSRWLRAGLLVAFLLTAANYKLIFGLALPQWDAVDQFGPEFALIADNIKAHHLLMWDPWSAAGTPDLAEPQYGVTSPLLLAIAFIAPSAQSGFVAYWMVLWVIGSAGMLLLCKHLGAPIWGAVVISLGFATSGFFTGHGEHTPYISSVSFLPWVLWRFDEALLQQRVWYAIQAGALFGASALGGYPAFTIMTPFFLAVWALGRVVWPASFPKQCDRTLRIRTAFVSIAVAIALGGVVCSPIYLGFGVHTNGYSDHTGPRPRMQSLASNRFPAIAFTTISSPYLPLLNMSPGAIWPETDLSMCSIYMGSGIMLLSILALSRRNLWRWWLGLICLFFACCSVGNQLPVRGWLYDLVVPTRYFRNASLFTAYVLLSLAILAAYGTRDLTSSLRKHDRTVFVAIAVALSCGAIAAFKAVVHVAHKRLDGFRFANDHLFLVWIGLVLLAFLYRQRVLSTKAMTCLFVAIAIFDAIATIQISRPVLYTEATLPWWHVINAGDRNLNLHTLARIHIPPESLGTYPNNRNIVVKLATFQSYVTLDNRFYWAFAADEELRQIAVGANRICFASQPPWMKPNNADFSRFVRRWHEMRTPLLVLHTPDSMKTLSNEASQAVPSDTAITSGAACSPITVSALSYSPNSLSFSYTASQAGWLLITDRWAPGWDVRVNGSARPSVAGDFIFRAVHVDPGNNRVEFTYNPRGFLVLTLLSWGILIAIAVIEIFRLEAWYQGQKPQEVFPDMA